VRVPPSVEVIALFDLEAEDPSSFEPISKDSLSRLAYQEIRASLMRGRLRPGQRLVLRQLAMQLGISQTPVREALLRLVSEQGLEFDGRGTVVVPSLNLERYLEVRDLRIELEGRSAARAAGRATPADIEALAAIHSRFAAADARGESLVALEANEAFHYALCRLGDSPVLFHIVQQLWMRCGPLLTHLYANGSLGDAGNHPHLQVITALRGRDGAEARAAITQDIDRGGRPILDRLRELGAG
jgi:DNA-binding GntR family transcriptional regulator